MRGRCLLFGCVVVLLSVSARAEEPAPAPEPSGVAATVARLQHTQAPDDDGRVPPAIRPLLTTLKSQIRDFLARELRTAPGNSAERVQGDLVRAFAREGVTVGGVDETAGPYGSVDEVEVSKPAGHDDLLAVRVSLGIACGSDNALYLFQRRNGDWRPIFSVESDIQDSISDAMGMFDFGVSPADPSGSFFVVAMDVNAACWSNWQAIRWRAWRLGGEAPPSKPFFEGWDSLYLGDDDSFALTVTGDVFRVSFRGYQNLDDGVLVRDHVRAYRVSGTKVERVPPLATEPEGFLDEWIHTAWEDAKRWTGPKVTGAQVWHDRLAERLDKIYPSFGRFEACGKERSRWQIGLDFEADPGRNPLPLRLFFTVSRQGDDYRVDRIDVRPIAGCVATAPPES
jgi:hypothetical protein